MKLYRVEQYEDMAQSDHFINDTYSYPDQLTITDKDRYDNIHMKYFLKKESAINYARAKFNEARTYYKTKYPLDTYDPEEIDVTDSFQECPEKGVDLFIYPKAKYNTIAMGCIQMDSDEPYIDFWYIIYVDEFDVETSGPELYRVEEYDFGDDSEYELLNSYTDPDERGSEEEGYYSQYKYTNTLEEAKRILKDRYGDQIEESKHDWLPERVLINSQIAEDTYSIWYRDDQRTWDKLLYSKRSSGCISDKELSKNPIYHIVGRIIKMKIEDSDL